MTTDSPRPLARPSAVVSVRREGDDGMAEVVTVVFLTGVVLVLVLLLTLAGRGAEASTRVGHTAEASAQAAALQRDPALAANAATQIANSSLAGFCDGGPQVTVDTSGWAPGGLVSVVIACRVRTSDLGPLPLPGTVTSHGSSAAVIDAHRFVEPLP